MGLVHFITDATRATVIYSAHVVPSGSNNFALNFLATSSSDPRGCLLMDIMTSSMV